MIADLGLAQLMAAGRVRGDWELALAFSVVPVIGVVYGLALLRGAVRNWTDYSPLTNPMSSTRSAS